MKLVCDLILTNLDTGKITTISSFEDLKFDEERKDIIIYSYGYISYIKNIENFKFEFKFRIIPDDYKDEPTIENSND